MDPAAGDTESRTVVPHRRGPWRNGVVVDRSPWSLPSSALVFRLAHTIREPRMMATRSAHPPNGAARQRRRSGSRGASSTPRRGRGATAPCGGMPHGRPSGPPRCASISLAASCHSPVGLRTHGRSRHQFFGPQSLRFVLLPGLARGKRPEVLALIRGLRQQVPLRDDAQGPSGGVDDRDC